MTGHDRFRVVIYTCLLALGGVYAPAQAAAIKDLSSLDFECLANIRVDTVVGASRFKQKASEAPASVTIVSAEQIADFGYTTLPELLDGVRGYYINHDRVYGYLGVRGLNQPGDYNSRTLFLINGHRFNDSIYGWAVLDGTSPLDLALLDHVEIIRGPSSSLYGTSAFLAVINLVTRRGNDLAHGE